ncbi:MAG: molecular chaperone [Coprothermobacter sp.]|nr:molecular chaperone [Coprothermobacter sp.]
MQLRHELKHFVNIADYQGIRSRLRYILQHDEHAGPDGRYTIRSLYFDNADDRALLEKINGLNRRTKFRIRFYNSDPSFIRLEKKTRIDGLSSKESAPITRDQCRALLAGDTSFLRSSVQPLFVELYARIAGDLLRPKTIVDYVREAYIYGPGNVRVTFDTSMRTGLASTDVFSSDVPTVEALNGSYVIMEVKYDAFLPDIVADAVQTDARGACAISKYALCRLYGL